MSTLEIDIRPARPADAGPITAVHDEAWRLAYRGIIPGRELERMIARRGPDWWAAAIRRGSRIAVLTVAGVTAGYVSSGRNRTAGLPSAAEIYEIYVKPEYQGIGLGSRLFLTARRELAQRGMAGLAVWALADNETACGFYRALGGRAAARGTERFGATAIDKIAFVWD